MAANTYSLHAAHLIDVYHQKVKPLRTRTKWMFGAAAACIKRNANVLLNRPLDAKLDAADSGQASAIEEAAELIAAGIECYGVRPWNRKLGPKAFKGFQLLMAPDEMDNGLVVEVIESRRKTGNSGAPPLEVFYRRMAGNIRGSLLVCDIYDFVRRGGDPGDYAGSSRRGYPELVRNLLAKADSLTAGDGPASQQFARAVAIVAESLSGGNLPDDDIRTAHLAAVVGLMEYDRFQPWPVSPPREQETLLASGV